MILVGIDVAKEKHDCCIINSEGEVLTQPFTISNDRDGFNRLLQEIWSHATKSDKIKVGLEATGHYSYNILGFLLSTGLPTYVINPLHTNLYRKSLTLRKTKTDQIDAKTIATMLLSDVGLKPYTDLAYHNEELKSLTRYRFEKIQDRSRLRQTFTRLVTILFPEFEKLVPSLHMVSVYAMFREFPGACQIAHAHLKHLTNVLSKNSRGRYSHEKALEFRNAAAQSIGSHKVAESLELQHTIALINELNEEISQIEEHISDILGQYHSPMLSIPGIGEMTCATILAEIGDFSNFSSPDKILAFAGMSPSTYQSGQLQNCYAHMEKRGSKYLRYALFTAARCVCNFNPVFSAYLSKKRAEGKHYNVALSHVSKKLVRLIFALEKTQQTYKAAI